MYIYNINEMTEAQKMVHFYETCYSQRWNFLKNRSDWDKCITEFVFLFKKFELHRLILDV